MTDKQKEVNERSRDNLKGHEGSIPSLRFLDRYPEFKYKLMYGVNNGKDTSRVLIEHIEEILDKHFVRKEEYDQMAGYCTYNHGPDWIEKQKVKDVLDKTIVRIPIGRENAFTEEHKARVVAEEDYAREIKKRLELE